MKTTRATRKGKTEKAIQLNDGTLAFDKYRDVEDILYSAYSEKFQTGKTSDPTWLSVYVNNTLDALQKSAKTNPETAVSAMREINRAVVKTADYINSKKKFDTDLARYLLQKKLFPWQKEVFEDNYNKFTLLAGRRSGKTFLTCFLAIQHCLEKGEKIKQAAIIGLTVERTANLYWENLKKTIEDCHIDAKFDNGIYKITFSNGNFIQLFGNNNKAEREKLRGFDISFAAIDEMQSQQGLLYLIEDILKPMLKAQNGTIVTLGTGPLSAGTYWERLINDDSYHHYHATMENNPTIPNYENALQSVLEENKWTPDNITFRREYKGEIAYDTERLIYAKRTYYEKLPDVQFISCYIGIDYGWADYSSLAPILITSEGDGYLIEEWKKNKTASSEIVKTAKELVERIHKQHNIPNENILLIADSSHQQVSADIYNQGIYNITNAYKLDEDYQIARVAEALSIGQLYIQKGGYFDQECDSLIWKWNEERGVVIYEIDDKTFHPDMADSVKYAWNTYLTNRNAGQ